jgi:hypothetical protein
MICITKSPRPLIHNWMYTHVNHLLKRRIYKPNQTIPKKYALDLLNHSKALAKMNNDILLGDFFYVLNYI